MGVDRDEAFDPSVVGVDPRDFASAREPAVRPKKTWHRRYIRFPWSWMDRLKNIKRGATYRLALLLVYEHWRNGGAVITLPNVALKAEGISRQLKWLALSELEAAGLITIERRPWR